MSGSNALTIVNAAKEKGALVFANIENMEAKVDLYRTEVTELALKESDFHVINGKFMPSKTSTDRIGEACGVQFIQSTCKVFAETRDDPLCGKHTSFRGEAQGKVRMPDGSWRFSTVDEYEFDPVLRAMLDKNVTELNEQTKKTVARTILEYTKVARQRAATGARLRVIRQLTGMPSSFEKADSLKPFVFTRVVQNTDYILKTPEGRAMATAQALGIDVASLFGKPSLPPAAQTEQQNAAPDGDDEPEYKAAEQNQEPENNNASGLAAQAADDVDFPDEKGEVQSAEEKKFSELFATLEEYLSYKDYLDVETKSGTNPYKLAMAELKNPDATIASRKQMIERIRDFLIKKQVRGVA